MNKKSFPDGSSLAVFNDNLPGFREVLIAIGVPVVEAELKAAACAIPICLAYEYPTGGVFYHHALIDTEDNGWSCILADKPGSMASKEAIATMAKIKEADMSTAELGENE